MLKFRQDRTINDPPIYNGNDNVKNLYFLLLSLFWSKISQNLFLPSVSRAVNSYMPFSFLFSFFSFLWSWSQVTHCTWPASLPTETEVVASVSFGSYMWVGPPHRRDHPTFFMNVSHRPNYVKFFIFILLFRTLSLICFSFMFSFIYVCDDSLVRFQKL